MTRDEFYRDEDESSLTERLSFLSGESSIILRRMLDAIDDGAEHKRLNAIYDGYNKECDTLRSQLKVIRRRNEAKHFGRIAIKRALESSLDPLFHEQFFDFVQKVMDLAERTEIDVLQMHATHPWIPLCCPFGIAGPEDSEDFESE